MTPLKKYNLFIFFTTFAKCLVEVFIPIILYNGGLSLGHILLFLLISFLFNIILSPIISSLGRRWSFKWIAFISAFLFVGMYYGVLNNINIYFLAFLYSFNNTCYYIAKHNYATSVLDTHIGSKVGSFMIAAILSSVPASYVGAIFLKQLPTNLVIIFVLIIYLIGIIPLLTLDIKNHAHDGIFKMLIKIPRKNIIFFMFGQFKVIFFFLFPLYIYIYIKNKYDFIGLIGIIVGLASIVFIYFHSHFMDKKKKDFMFASATILSIILFIEIKYATPILLIFLSFFEGLATKMYEMSMSRDFYLIGKKVDKTCYFLVFEILNNITKSIIVLSIYLFNFSLFTSLMILIIGIFVSGIIKFESPE